MAIFPPSKGNKPNPPSPPQATESGPVSTGNGGLKKSIPLKNAAIKGAPGAGPDKTNSLF